MTGFTRRDILKTGVAAVGVMASGGCAAKGGDMADKISSEKAKVYFTEDLSAAGIKKMYDLVKGNLTGKIAVKVHTGEPKGPNIIPPEWVKSFISYVPNSRVVECNVYYESPRITTEGHKETLKINGWTTDVDIMDADGEVDLPIAGGKWFDHLTVGKNLLNYDSFLALTHFKGHTMGGFGGSIKNIAIGCGSGKTGKKQLHTPVGGEQWGFTGSRFMENMVEGCKAVVDHFGKKIAYINVLRNMSRSCDCEGTEALPVELPNLGILASTDILAIDQASVDMIYNLPKSKGRDEMIERIESREGLRQLTYMAEIGLGNKEYELIKID